LNKPPRIQAASGPSDAAAIVRGRFLGDCARLLADRLPSLWETLFGKLDDALHNLADKATNDLGYRVYYDAREIIVKQHRRLQGDFLRRVEQGAGDLIAWAREPGHTCEASAESGLGDLTLLAESDLEELLAKENLVSKAESRYRRELMEMDRRLAAVMGWGEVGLHENPFGPTALCNAFGDTLATLPPFEPSVKLVVYKLFDRHLMDQLGDFYRSCLTEVEFLPGTIALPAASPRETAASVSSDHGPSPDAQDRSPDSLSIPFDALRALLARRRPGRAARTDTGRVKVATAELLALLDSLDVVPDPATANPEAEILIRTRLSAALSTEDRPRRALAEHDEDTLDLVFLFFEHLLAGRAIPDPIKIQIGRMQIPVAKMALLDKVFFSDEAHPARVLINDIGRAAIGWNDDDGRGPDSLYGMIERVVERLVLDFDGDPKLFSRMDRYFRAFVAREDARAEARASALAHTRSGDLPRDRLDPGAAIVEAEQAAPPMDPERAMVAAAIAERVAPYAQVPATVETLLREGWSLVLLEIHRSRGSDGPEWQAALELIDRLLWSVSAKRTAEERRQLLNRIPRLLETLRRQLAEVGCDPRLAVRWLAELQTLHLDVLQGSARGAVRGVVDTADDRASAVPPGWAIGDWIDWAREDAGRVRLKLVAWSPERDELLFMDRQGQSPTRFSAQGLAEAIEAGRVSILGNAATPMADRALRAMLTHLQKAPSDG
jgi:hypothetical protein